MKVLAGQIAAVAVLMKHDGLSVFISSELDEKAAKDFTQFVAKSLACSVTSYRKTNGGNEE